MEDRRQFLKKSLGFMGLSSIFFLPLGAFVQRVYGEAKRILLPRGTKPNSLIQKNPKSLDTRNLEITPIKNFKTMGLTDYRVDLAKWRLIVEGAVQKPLKLTYQEMRKLPSMEKEVLLICPGFFRHPRAMEGDRHGASFKRSRNGKWGHPRDLLRTGGDL